MPLVAALLPSTALATPTSQPIDARGGSVGTVALAIGRQSNVSVSLRGGIASRPAQGISGRMTAAQALTRLARSQGLTLTVLSDRAFVLAPAVPKPKPLLRLAAAPRPAPAAVPVDPLPLPVPADIIVTASKRDTALSHFAGQWNRIEGDRLTSFGVAGSEAVEAQTVGFSSTHLGAGRNKLFIRGIADSSFSGPTQSPVGQYFGDMRIGYNGADPDLRMVDMESVEVMEGPQGTLYGAGALGGIVLLKPNRPDPRESSGRAAIGSALTQHGDPGYDAAATLNLPVAPGSALRLSGYRVVEGGYIDNRLTGERDVNRVRVLGGRFLADAELAPGWKIEATALGQKIEGDDSQYADQGGDRLSRSSTVEQPFGSNFALASLVLRKDIGDLRFRSTLGATWQKGVERFDASQDGRDRLLEQRSEGRQLVSETRLWRPMKNGWSWLVGISHLENRYDVDRQVMEDGTATDLSGVSNRMTETTLYGEAGVSITDRIEATAGGRMTFADVRGSGQHLSPLAIAAIASVEPERQEKRFSPSASLLARPVDGVTLYARYQQGFRPGGLSVASEFVRRFQRDVLSTLEVGFRAGKPKFDRVSLAGSVSRSRWYDIQADYLDPGGLPVTDNIGDGQIWSATINGGYRVTKGLRIEAGAAFNDGRIVRPSEAFRAMALAAAARPGEQTMNIPNIARWVGRIGIDWTTAVRGDWVLEANLYGRYVGRSRLGVGPQLGEEQGDYFDSGLSLRVGDHAKGLSLSVSNLTDSVGNRFAFGAPIFDGDNQLTPLRPRTIRLGFDWGF